MSHLQKGNLFFTLLTSGSTLVCCAIPAILVLLGAGSTVAAVVGIFPQLVWLSEHKLWLFGLGGIMLAVSGYFNLVQPATCPIDPQLAENCRQTKRWSRIVWWVSVVIYGIGFATAYILPLFLFA